ncbi:MAG: hypothetical protein ACI90U_000900 [Pseudomonadales bacterium]|jgi:hypothetical protein
MRVASIKQVSMLAALSFSLVTTSWVAAVEISTTDCLAYWQLRSVGLSRDYGIASAKLSDQYYQRYQTELNLLKQDHSPKILVQGMFSAMAIMLDKIDDDYDRTAELDADYSAACQLEN